MKTLFASCTAHVQRVAQRGAVASLTALCALLAASNALVAPIAAQASPVATTLTTLVASTAPSTAGYDKHKTRSRFVVPKENGRGPHTKGQDYQSDPLINTPKNLAPTNPAATPATTGEDLAETEDVQLTPAVRTLAASLGNNPVQIYNWVRDHVVFTPTYGSIQGSEATLQTRHGNAFDTASLLIALLRAANIPARYTYGTIEVPAALAQNWVGGVTTPSAAVALFAQGGIPTQGVINGGAISAIQVEHVWVQAFVDFNPSRGAINRSAKTWVPLDAAFKQYRYTQGLAVRADVPVDTAALSAQLTQGATQTADTVQGLNAAALGTAYNDFTTRVESYISTHKANATVNDVLGSQTTISEDLPLLAGALPYKTITIGAVYAALPDTLRWQIQYGLYASDLDRSNNNAIVAVTQSLPKSVGKRITLSFTGATTTDKNKLGTLLNSNPLPASLSASSVQTTAQLSVDGQAVATGGNVTLGNALVGGFGVYEPRVGAWTYTASSRVIAGETHSIAAIGQGVAPSMLGASRDRLNALSTQLAAQQYSGITQDALVGEVLNYAALAYTTTVASNTELMCKACGVVGYALPTITRVNTHAAATYVKSVPQTLAFPGLALNVEMLGRSAVALDGNQARALAFQRTYGEHASAYTHLLLDALFTDANHFGRAASTVRALEAANAAKQKIFQVTSNNSSTIVPQLNVDPITIGAINDAVAAGLTATISQANVAVGNWNGVGYALEDATTGSGDYEITDRDEAQLIVAGGWLPLALAGPGLAVQGDQVATALQSTFTAETNYYAAAVALLADYGSIAWNNFVGAPLVVSQWWLCDLWDGLPASLSGPGTTLVSSISVDDFTPLPGAPTSNNPPYFTSTPVASGAVGQPYQYFATAVDPDGNALTFQLANGPAGMTMSANGLVGWASPITGSYPITLRVSDGKANVDQNFTLTIGQVMPLDLTLAVAPQFVNDGDTVMITAATTGGSGTVTKSLTVDGATVALDANGQAKVVAHGAGGHPAVATASDNNSSLTRTNAFGVNVAGDTTPPTVKITAPNDGDTLTTTVSVSGTVSDANVTLWQLLASPSGQGQWRELARGTHAVNGAMAPFDPSQLANGQYDLALIAYDANGQQGSDLIHVLVYGDLKIGQFTVSFNDLQLDVGGVPLTVTRTYDSRKKDIKGDFGYGWSLSYQNATLQRNRPLGEAWEFYQTGFLTFCVRPIGKRVVSIAMADGKVHQFDVKANPDCALGQVPEVFDMAFTPRPGTTSTLEILDGGDLLFQGGTVYDTSTAAAFDSVQYRLTTLDNFQYVLTSHDNANTFQIVQITDPNGEVLNLNAQGMTSSNGAAIQFQRDAQGRITQVSDVGGRTVKYAYTAAGDLDSITSPLNQVSRNQYATVPLTLAHLLTSYTDPSGTQALRNEYDASGKLIAQYDALGNKVDSSQRDTTNHTQAVTDRNGNTTTYTYDDQGNVTQIVNALGGVTKATFDALGNQLSVTDPLGRTTKTTYDTNSGTVLTESDALGNTTVSDWNFFTMFQQHTPQNLKSATDALGHTTSFAYTDPGMLRAITDPLGHGPGFGWGGANFDQLAQMTDATGNTTHYQNDAQGHRTQETDPLGNVTKYSYDAAGHLLTTTKTRAIPGGTQTLTTTNTIDANGNVLSTTDALGNISQMTWTPQKNPATQTDALDRVTTYSYDALGRATKATYPDGTSESTTYDANGNTIGETDRAGRTMTTAYDALNRPIVVTNADGTATQTTYDAAGQVAQMADELSRVTKYEYDAAGRKTKSTDAAGNATGYAYDAAGKLTAVSDALGRVTRSDYDAANRKTQTTWPDSSTTQYAYDAAGRKTKDTDPAGRATLYSYDADGRLNQVTDALGKLTKYNYDELGNKTSQTDALNHTTQWGYDGLSRATSHALPDGRYETMAYDAAGRLINRTDYAGNATGYQYDAADRLKQRTLVDGTVIGTTYTASGQIASLAQTQGSNSVVAKFSYDALDRLTDIQNPDGSKLHYGYDAAGQRTSLTLIMPDGQTQSTSYSYDATGNLASVASNGKTFSYKYDAGNSKIERDDPNGNVTKYTYDLNGRLVGWATTQGSAQNAPTQQQGSYTLNAAGQRTALTYQAPDGQARSLSYSYDGAGRLIGETRSLPNHTSTWILDAAGNRIGQTQDGQTSSYSYDSADRLTTVSGANAATYSWDSNGQLQSKTIGSGASAQKTIYSFDARHELIGVTLPDGTKIDFRYAADGNLASRTKTSPGGTPQTIHYLVDPNLPFAQVVAEYDDQGHAAATYTYGDELLQRSRGAQGTYYYHDGLGSVTALTDEAGTAIQTYGYDAWGNAVETTGADTNPYRFTGERYDADIGLIYLRARWYEPQVGRFVSADEAQGQPRLPISHNKYLYANGDPQNGIDPLGTETLGDLGAAMDIQGILTNIAKDQIIGYVQDRIFGCPEVDDGQPCLYEVLVAQLIQAVAGSLSDPTNLAVAGALVAGAGSKTNGHHVIPRYMCGAEKQIDLANLTRREHDKLHAELYNFNTAVRVGSLVYNLLFRKKTKLDIDASPIAQTARTAQGRAAITVGLGVFYASFGFGGSPWVELGQGQTTKLPIGGILALEAPRYISYNHSTTGSCKKVKFI